MNSYTKDQLNLHFIVFIWGFTAILGKFITIDALALVYNRTAVTSVAIGIYLLVLKRGFKANSKRPALHVALVVYLSRCIGSPFSEPLKFQTSASHSQVFLLELFGRRY